MATKNEFWHPVICNFCGKHYDLGRVTVTARYADATCFTTPCCGRQADDRQWKSSPDFRRDTGATCDMFGNVYGKVGHDS